MKIFNRFFIVMMMGILEHTYCNICDKLCIELNNKKHLKSSIHSTNIRKRQQLNNTKANT